MEYARNENIPHARKHKMLKIAVMYKDFIPGPRVCFVPIYIKQKKKKSNSVNSMLQV